MIVSYEDRECVSLLEYSASTAFTPVVHSGISLSVITSVVCNIDRTVLSFRLRLDSDM